MTRPPPLRPPGGGLRRAACCIRLPPKPAAFCALVKWGRALVRRCDGLTSATLRGRYAFCLVTCAMLLLFQIAPENKRGCVRESRDSAASRKQPLHEGLLFRVTSSSGDQP